MLRRPTVTRLLLCVTAFAVAAPSAALAAAGGGTSAAQPRQQQSPSSPPTSSGGTGYGSPAPPTSGPTVAGERGVLRNGVAYAPADAPMEVKAAIWAGNSIQRKPYRSGGGHGRFNDTAYDCSGTVSFVLHAAGLLSKPLDSGSFMRWGDAGAGQWMTVYTNPGHAYILIAGLRLDTSTGGDPSLNTGTGPRWRKNARSAANGPFTVRHPDGF